MPTPKRQPGHITKCVTKMCRYGINVYKPRYAYFECRKTFKIRLLIDIDVDSVRVFQ